MENVNKTIQLWLDELNRFQLPDYEKFPDIDLYMDQVVTYLERQLQVYATSSLDKQITPSMINNYVKGSVIKAPISKKYNREHLSLIDEVCMLKQVLSIAEVKQILDSSYANNTHSEVFNQFKEQNRDKTVEAIKYTKERLNEIEENDVESLTNLALDLALTAQSFIAISKRILFYTHLYEEFSKPDDDKKKKKQHDEGITAEDLESLINDTNE